MFEVDTTGAADIGRQCELPRRVLHVLNSAGGGAAISTIDLIQSFRELGVDSVAVCHEAGSEPERRRLSDAVEGRALFTPLYWSNRKTRAALWKRPILEAMQLRATGWRRGAERRVAEFAERYQIDLIHTNTFVTPEGGRAARSLGVPHVWHVRELVGPGTPYRFAREGRAMRDEIGRHASVVVANSRTTAEHLTDWVPDGLLRTVPNGIAVERFAGVVPQNGPGPLIVGMVANLTLSKKCHRFFELAEAVAPKTAAEFHLFGRLPAERHLATLRENLRKRGLSDRVRLRGFVADPVAIMREIDVLAHTADQESFGRVFVEAMASALPVVAVCGGGAAEIVVDGVTGLLAPPDDARAMAACVERLAGDPQLRATLGTAGRCRAAEEYTLGRCVRGMADVYRFAMGRPLAKSVREGG